MEAEAAARWRPGLRRWRRVLESRRFLAPALIAPAVIFMALVVGVPFGWAVYLSLTDSIGGSLTGNWVGFDNFTNAWSDDNFRRALRNTLLFTFASQALVLVGAAILAHYLIRDFRGKWFLRFLIILPWAAPVALSTLGWLWVFDSLFSVINWVLLGLGVISRKIPWLGDPVWAMASVCIVNVWRGLPFFAVSLLAGLMAIPRHLYESADVDGAPALRQFWHITLPLLQPVIAVVVLFSTIWTFADFQIVYILTHGGPVNATQIFATMAYDVALVAGRIGEGSAIALFLFPFLLIVILLLLRRLRAEEGT